MNHFSKYWGSQKVTFNFHFMIRWVQNEDENRNLIDPPEMEPIHHFHCEMVFMLLFGFNCAYKCWYHHSISSKTENSDSSFDFLSFSLNTEYAWNQQTDKESFLELLSDPTMNFYPQTWKWYLKYGKWGAFENLIFAFYSIYLMRVLWSYKCVI